MHYDGLLRGFFPESNPIMKDKKTGKSIPINRKMSQLDIQKLNDMYPCKQSGAACGKLCVNREFTDCQVRFRPIRISSRFSISLVLARSEIFKFLLVLDLLVLVLGSLLINVVDF